MSSATPLDYAAPGANALIRRDETAEAVTYSYKPRPWREPAAVIFFVVLMALTTGFLGKEIVARRRTGQGIAIPATFLAISVVASTGFAWQLGTQIKWSLRADAGGLRLKGSVSNRRVKRSYTPAEIAGIEAIKLDPPRGSYTAMLIARLRDEKKIVLLLGPDLRDLQEMAATLERHLRLSNAAWDQFGF